MFIGGYISASGLGLTCPEWPQCPNGMMPSAEYFIEWTHRLIAATVGVLVISTMVASITHKNSDLKIKITSSLATGLVITQIGNTSPLLNSIEANILIVKDILIFNGTTNYIICIPYGKNSLKDLRFRFFKKSW